MSSSRLPRLVVAVAAVAGVVVAIALARIRGDLGDAAPSAASAVPASAPGRPATSPATDWPRSRGDLANTGVAAGPLPAHLVQRWAYATGGPVKSSPVVASGRVYVGSDDGHLHAIDVATGQRVWAVDLGSPVAAPPVVEGELIVVGSTAGALHAVSRDGRLRWTAPVEGRVTGAATIVRDEPRHRTLALVGSHGGFLEAFEIDSQSATPAWRYALTDPVNGGVAIQDGHAIFGACDGQLHVVSLADGSAARVLDAGGIVAGTVAVAGPDAYFGTFNEEIVRASWKTGAITWRFHDQPFKFEGSPALTSELVLVGGQDKALHAVERATGRERWSFRTLAKVDGAPVVAGDRVVVGSFDGRLYVLDVATGEKRDSFEVGGRIGGAPAVVAGLVVVGTESNDVVALGDPP
ncbi:MAG: PQQ-binding-like beta-propeller repeat protein [Deltaproteobacteria bacterium]|nr:PQQ-binding-like beta-propeller repeat protein [Deltaproteobacteria bacterium]